MKTNEQNQKEVIGYLKKLSDHFFESEDGLHYQFTVNIESTGEFVFIKDSVATKIDIDNYIKDGMTYGKTLLKNRFFPKWDRGDNRYGHAPKLKMRAVRKRAASRIDLVRSALEDYLK